MGTDDDLLAQRDRQQPLDELLGRLESVVEELEAGELRLERSLQLFEQGLHLSREACSRLEEAERRIEALLDDAS